jgi:purine-binding chemotaxis protein CheW
VPRKKKETAEVAAVHAESGETAPSHEESSEQPLILEYTPADFGEAPVAPDVVDRALTFRLDDQLYGLPIEYVQEIQQLVELMPLPDSAPALVGLLDVRGIVVPAVDLRVLVGMEPKEYTLETPMIFCRVHGRLVCLIVDAVEDVVEIPEGSVQPPSNLYALADRMRGVCRLAEGLVLLFDPERLVPDAALLVADQAGGSRG